MTCKLNFAAFNIFDERLPGRCVKRQIWPIIGHCLRVAHKHLLIRTSDLHTITIAVTPGTLTPIAWVLSHAGYGTGTRAHRSRYDEELRTAVPGRDRCRL